jgi:hypothetical protein
MEVSIEMSMDAEREENKVRAQNEKTSKRCQQQREELRTDAVPLDGNRRVKPSSGKL